MSGQRTGESESILLKLCFIFVLSFILKMLYFYVTYIRANYHLQGNIPDLSSHVRFFEDLVGGKLFYLDKYHGSYSPVPASLVFILTYPLYKIGIATEILIMVTVSIILSISSVGLYLHFRDLDIVSWWTTLFIIINPIEFVGFMAWMGLSMAITYNSVIYISLIYRRMKQERINTVIAGLLMTVFMILSVSSHRTGMLIQLFAVFVFSLILIKENRRHLSLSLPIFVIISIVTWWRAGSLIKSHLSSLSVSTRFEFLLSIAQATYYILIIIFIIFCLLYIMYTGYRPDFASKLTEVDQSYLLTGIALFLVPLNDPFVSFRFITAISYLPTSFLLSLMKNTEDRMIDKILWASLISIYIGLIIAAYVQTMLYMASF